MCNVYFIGVLNVTGITYHFHTWDYGWKLCVAESDFVSLSDDMGYASQYYYDGSPGIYFDGGEANSYAAGGDDWNLDYGYDWMYAVYAGKMFWY